MIEKLTEDKILQAAIDDATGNALYECHKDAFIKGAQWALGQDRWVSVAERLPEPGERVMIYCRSQGVQICHRAYFDDTIDWLSSFDLSRVYLNITHWQSLPQIPKTESK